MQRARSIFRDLAMHTRSRIPWSTVGLAVLLTLPWGMAGRAQLLGGSSGQGQGSGGVVPFETRQDLSTTAAGDLDPVLAERRMRALNIERQRQIVADAGKLLRLARELNEEIARANAGSLTPEALRRIAEIEKLARRVRQKMVDGVPLPTVITPPPAPMLLPSR